MRVLRTAITFLFILTLSAPAFAQTRGFHGGFRLGVGSANFRIDTLEGETGKLMLSGGFHAGYQFTQYFALEVEALITGKGAKGSGRRKPDNLLLTDPDNYDEKYRLIYAEVPVFLKLGVPLSKSLYLKAFAGPSINFNLYADYNLNYENSDMADERDKEIVGIETMEYSAVGGAGFDMQAHEEGGIFSIDVRYSYGLTKFGALNTRGHNGYNNYIGLFVGYTF